MWCNWRDTLGLGPSTLETLQVRILSSAPIYGVMDESETGRSIEFKIQSP